LSCRRLPLIRAVYLAALLALVPAFASAAEPQLAHMVFFTLAEDNAANQQKLVDACEKYLGDHEGTVYFSVGNLVFKDKAAHDKYQTHERHLKFIEENKALWGKVRVFDSYVKVK
jgi:hypothetical protein